MVLGLGHKVLGPEWTFGEWGGLVRRCLADDESQWPKDRIRGRLTYRLRGPICNVLGMTPASIERYEHVIALLPADNDRPMMAVVSLFGGKNVPQAVIGIGPPVGARVRRRHASGAVAGRLACSAIHAHGGSDYRRRDVCTERLIEILLSPPAMIFYHHDLKIELDDAWWAEAQMAHFVPPGTAYRVDLSAAKGRTVFEVPIDEIGPVRRKPSVGIFNKNDRKTARERVLCILNGFRTNAAIPPIELVDTPAGSPFRYKLTAGTHRLYCSLAAGFSHVPAVEGFDITAPYI
jgi:hypothetical protein